MEGRGYLHLQHRTPGWRPRAQDLHGQSDRSGRQENTDGRFSKKLVGRDWKAGDTFTFNIEPQDGAPAPKTSTVNLTAPDAKDGDEVKFGFGTIDFGFGDIAGVQPDERGHRSKDFFYKVTEVKGDIAGIVYDDGNVATLTVTITDEGNGVLSAGYKLDGAVFTNTYKTGEVVVDDAMAKGGIQVVKTLTGRPIAAGDFQFTMDPVNDDAKAKFGKPRTIDTIAGDLGASDANTAVATTRFVTGLKFGLDDAGKTFIFKINESKGGGAGYRNDSMVHDLAISVHDNSDGTLRVEAKLGDAEPVVWTSADAERAPLNVPFRNAYEAGSITVGGDGIVGLKGKKVLTGRPLVAGEFEFKVTNAGDATKVVATGTNDAEGSITFSGITYTTEQLNRDVAAGLASVVRRADKDVYTYQYNVSEVDREGDGVVPERDARAFTVTVSDAHTGELDAAVTYPKGGMVFRNAYGADKGGTRTLAFSGTKVLKVESGNNRPDIAGKYNFTLTGSEGAPMPKVTEVTNGASGDISFGDITCTMENVFGATAEVAPEAAEGERPAAAADEPMATSGVRTKEFTYKISETGSVAGVAPRCSRAVRWSRASSSSR